MKRKHKIYSKPKKPFDKQRIDEEAKIKKDFGLKNKKEIWRAEAKIRVLRGRAKKLISSDPKHQKELFDRFKKMGLNVKSIPEILSLTKEDYLKRRLQTIVSRKFSTTMKAARQFINHKKVFVGKNIVNSPSYIVSVDEEEKIKIKNKDKKKPKEMKENE